jgi:hypothetical protein
VKKVGGGGLSGRGGGEGHRGRATGRRRTRIMLLSQLVVAEAGRPAS